MHYNCFYKLCRNFGNNVRIYVSVSASDTSHQVEDEIVDTSMIHWPFVIVGSFSIFSALILAILLCLPFRIPVYEETRQSQISMEANGNIDQKRKRVTVAEGQTLLFRLWFNLQTYKAHSFWLSAVPVQFVLGMFPGWIDSPLGSKNILFVVILFEKYFVRREKFFDHALRSVNDFWTSKNIFDRMVHIDSFFSKSCPWFSWL